MAIAVLATILTLILQIIPSNLAAPASGTVNVAYRKPVEAHKTCGYPQSEKYYGVSQMSVSPRDRKESICYSFNSSLSHNASALVDGNLTTWWQSTASVNLATITLSLSGPAFKYYYAETIQIRFGEYYRPRQMAFYKSTDNGKTFTPWHYYVSYPDINAQCMEKFNTSQIDKPGTVGTVLCNGYGYTDVKEIVAISQEQKVEWRPSYLRGKLNKPSQKLLEWMKVTDIRVEFKTLERVFDVLSTKWHHYAVREVRIHGFCSCNGHGVGCEYNVTMGDNQCKCQTGTCGYYCDKCCPVYNQYPWKQGTTGPLVVDSTSACQPCNCHDHSSVCVYNETIARMSASLDTAGNYSGGGVCQDCQHNTEGVNCGRCKPLYFRPANRSKNAINVCEDCNCSIAGSYNHSLPGVLYLDCIRDYNQSAHPNMNAGDCFCKNNTMGRRCNFCKPGYHNLSAANPEGCQVCQCDESGTVNGSNVCQPDIAGQCPCKVNVHGLKCDTCNDTFYDLSKQDVNGCKPCLCDVGGARGPVCNKASSGQCSCLTHVTGRRCDRPMDEYYYHGLHFIGGDAVHQLQTNSWVFTFQVIPGVNTTSGFFTLVLSYQNEAVESVTITVQTSATTLTSQMSLANCNQTCYQNLTAFGERRLSGNVTVNVTYASGSALKGNRVVALPREFYQPSLLGEVRAKDFLGNCSVTSSDVKIGSNAEKLCRESVFTLTTGYLGKALACKCHPIGSVNATCAKYGGQCHCKPGVTGRICDRCQAEFYNLTSMGCSACNCVADDKVCNPTSGQCKCPSNTVGRVCDSCSGTYWGWNSTTGCQACNCNATGSSILQCNLTNGICSCKAGVTRDKCTECRDGYKNFTNTGCTSCACDKPGSLNSICAKASGQCPCKNNSIGLTCYQCKSGTFYITESNPIGCTNCICSGITSNCSSTTQYRYQRSVDLGLWLLGKKNSSASIAVDRTIMVGDGGNSMAVITGNIFTGQVLYWKVHANFTKESMVGSYGGNLSFMLHVSNLSGAVIQSNPKLILKGSNGISIERNIPAVPINQPATRTVLMKETSWVYAGTSTAVTRSHFMLVLAKLIDVLVTASLYSGGNGYYNTSFGGVVISSVRANPAVGNKAFEVEQCSCGPEYTGLSCERCAPGHHRVNISGDPFFGKCIPCTCNGHTNDCYASTGKCYNCKHNTTGDHCELCGDGFHGNATDGTPGDCKRCPCDAPRATTTLCKDIAGSAVCLNCSTGYEGPTCGNCQLRYFGKPLTPGGNCSLCQCNNNTDICNTVSGECTGCKYNTTGFHCERCDNGTYGDATKQQCKACLCDGVGASHNVCDHRTGQCPCKPNVGERNCSKCQKYSYGFSGSGCTECKCNKFGSSNLQCNESGICECSNHTLGEKCDLCEWGFFGLPNITCQACACNETGAHNYSRCDRVSGQCDCKPGVASRQCDRCSVQHINLTSEGCDACPMCTRLGLQRSINNTRKVLKAADSKAREVDKLKVLKPELEKLATRITATQVSIAEFDRRISTVRGGVEDMKSNTLNKSVTALQLRLSTLSSFASVLKHNTSQSLTKVQNILNDTTVARNLVVSVNITANSIANLLNALKVSADDMLAKSAFLNQSYSAEVARANTELASARSANTSAVTAKDKVAMQRTTAEALNSSVVRDQNSFLTKQNEFKVVSRRADGVTRITVEVHAIVNQTKDLITQGINIITQSRQLLLVANNLLNTSWSEIAEGRQAYEDTTKLVKGSSGGIEELLKTLNSSLSPTRALLLAANLSVTVNGTRHAANLTAEALLRKNLFDAVKDYGKLAVEAIKQYESVVKLVNQSLETSVKVNASLHEIMKYLRNFTESYPAMKQSAQDSYNNSKALLDKTLARNIDIADLQTNVSTSNQTFQRASRVGRQVDEYHNILLSRSNKLITESEPGKEHSVFQDSRKALSYSSLANQLSNPLMNDAKGYQVEVARLDTVMTFINQSAEHSRQMMPRAFVNIQNTSETLPKVVSTIEKAKIEKNNTATLQEQLKSNMARVQEKLRQAKEKLAKIQHSLNLKGNTSVEYTPVGRMAQNMPFNDISLDFKSDHNVGPLFYFSEGTTDSHSSMSLTLVSSQYVRFTYNLGSGPISVTNWEVAVRQGKWYRVYASRYKKNARLTVTDYSTNYSRTYESNTNQIVPRTKMNFTSSSPLMIGGLPTGVTPNVTQRFFFGCIDNVVVNQQALQLWKPVRVNGNRYTCSKCLQTAFQTGFLNIIPGTSFFGSPYTYVAQYMGTFNVSGSSEMKLQFRTFHKTASLLNVQSDQGYIYGIYMNSSQVTFYFKNGSSVYTISSKKASYSDGRWYQLRVSRGLINATLSIRPVGSQVSDVSFTTLSSPLVLSAGRRLVFGGKDPQSSFLAPVSGHFAGAMRDIDVSSSASATLVPRLLNDKNLTIRSDHVDFCGVLRYVAPSVRFRGNGFAGLDTSPTDMNSISIRFKTLQPSGLLVFTGNKRTGYYFYLSIFHGNLYLINTNTSGPSTPLRTTRQTLNDGAFHTVKITFFDLRLQLNVDDGRIILRPVDTSEVAPSTFKLNGTLYSPFKLNGTLYVGGLEPGDTIPLPVPVVQPFVGEMKYLAVNGRIQNFFSGRTNQVSLAGGSLERQVIPTPAPTTPPPTLPPPTCGDRHPDFKESGEPDEVHLGPEREYVGFSPSRRVLNLIKRQGVISMKFRSLSPNGVLLYGADNITTPRQFISVEMVNGRIVFKYNTGAGLVRLESNFNNYSSGGLWYTVYLLRIDQFAVILVASTKDYKNTRKGDSKEPLVINTPIFIGGVPPGVNTSMLETGGIGFLGCLKSLSLQSANETENLNPRTQFDPKHSLFSNRSCSKYIQSQASFDGRGQILLYNEYNLPTTFDMALRFRTIKRSGVLLVLTNRTGPGAVTLEQLQGQVVLAFTSESNTTVIRWTDPSIPPARQYNASYVLCDNKFHEIRLQRTDNTIKMSVDKHPSITYTIQDNFQLNGKFYIGGVPDGSGSSAHGGFSKVRLEGCVESLRLDTKFVELLRIPAVLDDGVGRGCRAPRTS